MGIFKSDKRDARAGETPTVLSSDQAQKGYPVASPVSGGSLCCSIGTLKISEAPVAGDVWRMVRIPANVTIVGGTVFCDNFEGLDLDFGWEANGDIDANPTGLGDFGVLAADTAAGIKTANGYQFPLGAGGSFETFNQPTTLVFTVAAPPTTFAEGKIAVRVDYRARDW
jgi:hypothetical protein